MIAVVSQKVLVPVAAERADVLRELSRARAGLREIAVRLKEPDMGENTYDLRVMGFNVQHSQRVSRVTDPYPL